MEFVQHGIDVANSLAKQYAPLIDAAMMLATVGAVVVALYSVRQALREKQLRLNFRCELNTIMLPSNISGQTALYTPSHQSVTASLANVGFIASAVPYLAFGLSVPRSRSAALLNPSTDYRATQPLPLPPGKKISIELRPPEQLVKEIISIRPKYLTRWRCRKFRITFATEADDVFRATISKELRQFVIRNTSHLPIFYDPAGGRGHHQLQAEASEEWTEN